MELIDSSTPGDYIYKLDDNTRVLARVRRLPAKPGHLGIAVKVCELTGGGNPRKVGGEEVWTAEHTASVTLRGLIDNKDATVQEQIREIIGGIVARQVDNIEAERVIMTALAEIPLREDE